MSKNTICGRVGVKTIQTLYNYFYQVHKMANKYIVMFESRNTFGYFGHDFLILYQNLNLLNI